MDSNHNLSEEEIDQIANKLVEKLEKKLYLNIGKGFLGLIWRGIIVLLIGLAGYGYGVHWFK